jgi:hypothetical protein
LVPHTTHLRSARQTRVRGVLCRANSGLPSGHGVTAGTGYPRASLGRAATAAGMGTSAGRATLKELFIPESVGNQVFDFMDRLAYY